jgi:membrane fusion protein, multidrug efflux system
MRNGEPILGQLPKLSPRARLIAGAIVAVIVAALVWRPIAALLTKPKGIPPAPVTVAQAVLKNMTIREHAMGTVVSVATVNITARVGGQIVEVAFKEGQTVKKGDLLFRLDPRPLKASLDQAEAQFARDQATLVSNRKDAERNRALFAQNAVSAQARDQAVAAAKAMEATVQADKAAAGTARLNLEYSTIRSPIDGKTGTIQVQIGNLVIAGAATPLVTITQEKPVKISFVMSQDRLPQIQRQMHDGKLAAEIAADGGTASAPVDFTGNAVDRSNGTIELRATFPNADRKLVPGQMLGVEVSLDFLPKAVVVPRNAVNPGPDGNYLFVVADGKANMVPVTVLYDDGTDAAVKGKVKAGDTVVTEGQLRVVPGGKVKILKYGMGAANLTQGAPGAQ